MRIATFNVNSIKARLAAVTSWLEETQPDIACLQELKCKDETFPTDDIEALGYNCAVLGQKTYNGVALLSRYPLEDVRRGLPGDEADEQARYIEAVVSVEDQALRVASLYLPNGNPAPGDKFDYKLGWMQRLTAHARELLSYEEPLVLAGDYNVIPRGIDVWDPDKWRDDALFRPESRAAFRELMALGFTDAIEACHGRATRYSFWDYQGGAWQKDHGLRIDHLLLSDALNGEKASTIRDKVLARSRNETER